MCSHGISIPILGNLPEELIEPCGWKYFLSWKKYTNFFLALCLGH